MKKESKKSTHPFILFHVRDEGEWSKSPSLNLVAFATVDESIATNVKALFQSKTGQMPDNRTLMSRLKALMEKGGDALSSFVLSNDIVLLGMSLIDDIEKRRVPNLCYHIVIFEKVKGAFVDGEGQVDQKFGAEEINKTLQGSTTMLFSYYAHLIHTQKAPPISSYFSLAGQENLCITTMGEVKQLVRADNYDEVARVIAKTLDRLTDTRCANTFTAYATEIMIAGGTSLALKAAEEIRHYIPWLDQAVRCFEVAMVYSSQLKIESSVALCHLQLAIIRDQMMMLCDASAKEKIKPLILNDANKALKYYGSTPGSPVCQNLNRIIKNYTPFVCTRLYHRAEQIFAEAKEIFLRFQRNPNSVTIKELVCTQVLLDRLLTEIPIESQEMKEYCHYTLTKIHYSFAVITASFESAMEHLSVAEAHLNLAKVGGTKRSNDLLAASLLHMKGKVLLRFKTHKEDAVVALKKAYSIYQQYHNDAGLTAITCLAPSIANHENHISMEQRQTRK